MKNSTTSQKLFGKKWIVLVMIILIPALAWLYNEYKAEMEYRASVAPYHQMYEDAMTYYADAEKLAAQEKAMLQADTYGGATPEETLALFVQALDARDAKLASKYYMPWLQEKAYDDMKDWMDSDNARDFIITYQKHIISKKQFVSDTALYISDTENEEYPYRVLFVENKENNIWKITDF